jgi:type I restriction enzyme S subunit
MIKDLKPYPAMKDSRVPWLGEVPEHWGVHRLRNLAEMRVSNVDKHTKDNEQPVRLCNYVDVYKNDYIRPNMNLMRATATREEIERFRLSEGDVLITKDSEAWNDIGVPALVRESADDLISGYHLALLRPFRERIAGEFLFRSLQSTGVQYQFHVDANGVTRYGLSHAAIKSVWLPEPSLPEQAAIVRFLDHADRRIRRYIRAKQKLIKLLEEQKQAIIHRAATRGLDPGVRLKPSGVEWLGDVPEHWEVRTLGQIASSFRTGPFGSILHQSEYVEGGTPVINPTHMREGRIAADRRCSVPPAVAKRLHNYVLEENDVVFSRRGELGRCALVRESEAGWICGTGSLRVRIKYADLEPEYLIQVLQMRWVGEYLSLFSVGATMDSLNTGILKGVVVPLPPVGEQRKILEMTAKMGAALFRTADGARREIDLLREYRIRLIADVVTGKLDVREAAARLPDEVEEPEPLDEDVAETDAEDAAVDDADAATAAAEA